MQSAGQTMLLHEAVKIEEDRQIKWDTQTQDVAVGPWRKEVRYRGVIYVCKEKDGCDLSGVTRRW